ncbi:metallopeptidase TldD-related protein [Streptosporangium sp. NBC_01755]|uniref:metallopeptidase TldD-related protein n=1 Tax=unclassified Streptosporangium TaxID=2632669 RepID=UPI002DDA97AE|nr:MULTISPECIES: metallopeptidase TldD-related protein [unclassified Streptosporangium]WSA29123.1 metallopeptidase TldD-related protein [Streptosporangium sp. NBC_01810]WSC99431.1 metallopeptidase TldD-related protein [Streptosporangium sp. NBC_01755]
MSPQEMIEKALELSTADEVVVIVDEGTSANLRFAGNTLTTNGVSRSSQLTVISIVGRGVGVVSRAAVHPDQLDDVVAAADHAAEDAQPSEDARPLLEGARSSDWDDLAEPTSIGVFGAFAPALGEAFTAAEASGRRLYGFAEHTVTTTFVGTSTGTRLRHAQPTGRLELNAKSLDMKRSAWIGVSTRDFSDIDVAALDATLARRLEWAKNRVDLPAGRYETLLPPTAVSDLMIYLYWTAGARDALEGRTVFSRPGGGTRVGETLSESPIRLYGDPAAPGVECPPFVVAHASSRENSVFDNGLPLAATDWISDGKLANLLQTRYSAELTGLPVTPAIDNLIMRGPEGGRSLEEMIASTERGLLLTCLWYIREVDPQTLLLTGLTRDGVYLVENGEVVGEVNNFRFNESPVDLLRRLTEVGASEQTLPREWGDYFNRAIMPAIRVPDFNMSTVSQAN